jgi:hypothetical protein
MTGRTIAHSEIVEKLEASGQSWYRVATVTFQ